MMHPKKKTNSRKEHVLFQIGFLLLLLSAMGALLMAFWELRLKDRTYREEFRVQEGELFTAPFEVIYGVGLSDDRGKRLKI